MADNQFAGKRDEEPDDFGSKPWQRPVVDFTVDQVKQTCVKLVPQWKHLDPQDIKVVRFDAGTINYVYKVIPRVPNECPIAVFRVFEYSFNAMIDRAKESEAFQIAGEVGVGPKVLGQLDNMASNRGIRIEEFIDADPISFQDYRDPKIAALLAEQLANFHKLMTPRFDHWSKEPEIVTSILKWMNNSPDIIEQWSGEIYNMEQLKKDVDEYFMLLKNKAATKRFAFTQMFCHNDIHLFNIIKHNHADKVTLLDYEFVGHNYIGYDLCNYMAEAMVDYKGADVIPFMKYYIDSFFPLDVEEKLYTAYLDNMGVEYDENFLKQFKRDVNFFEIGWWLGRVFFNSSFSKTALDNPVKFACLIHYSQASYKRYKFLKQAAINENNWTNDN